MGNRATLQKSKIALIHLAVAQLKLSDEDYRAILFRVAGVRSSTELDDAGFHTFMDALSLLGFQSDRRRESTFGGSAIAGRRGMATPGHVAKIRLLWNQVTDGQGDDAGLGKWLEKRFGVSALRFVGRELAPKVIAGLQAWNRAKARRAAKSPT